MKKLILIFLFIFLNISFAEDLQNINGWKFSGEYLGRTELDGRDFSNITYMPIVTLMRARFGVEREITNKVSFKLQMQDSRLFGDNANGQNSSATYLYQGYVILQDLIFNDLDLQIGRFEMDYSNGRIFSNDEWSPFGKSFDGVKIDYSLENIHLSLFDLYTNNIRKYIVEVLPGNQPYPATSDNSSNIYGLWYDQKISESSVNAYLIYELNRNQSNGVNPDLNRYLIGGNFAFKITDNFKAFCEFNYQFGEKAGKKINAMQISADWNYKFDYFNLGVAEDISSGQNPTDATDYTIFENSTGTKHPFYGDMDYFYSAAGMSNLGIMDTKIYVSNLNPENTINYKIAYHHFDSQKKSIIDYTNFGDEIDATLFYKLNEASELQLGCGTFLPDDLMKYQYRIKPNLYRSDPGYWAYLQVNVKLK